MSIRKPVTLAAVMTPFPYHIDATDSIEKARQMMQEHKIHHLPVMVEGVVESVISDRDIRRLLQPGGKLVAEGMEVGDLCPVRAYIADVADPLDKILEAMADAHIGSVIVTKDAELAGIFTENDACRLFAEYLRGEGEPDDQVA